MSGGKQGSLYIEKVPCDKCEYHPNCTGNIPSIAKSPHPTSVCKGEGLLGTWGQLCCRRERTRAALVARATEALLTQRSQRCFPKGCAEECLSFGGEKIYIYYKITKMNQSKPPK